MNTSEQSWTVNTIISRKDYRDKFAKVKLRRTSVTLKKYTGEKVVPLGKLKVKVKYENTKRVLDLYVVQNDNVPLFGREWLRNIQFNWQSIKMMEATEKSAQPTPETVAAGKPPQPPRGGGAPTPQGPRPA